MSEQSDIEKFQRWLQSQLDDVKSLMLDFQFNNGDESIRLNGHALPYNLHIGRAMSYHE